MVLQFEPTFYAENKYLYNKLYKSQGALLLIVLKIVINVLLSKFQNLIILIKLNTQHISQKVNK